MKRAVFHAFAALAASALCPTFAGTLTWNGGNAGTWDATTANWLDEGGAATAWIDDSDASFANTAAMTLSVSGARTAGKIEFSNDKDVTFNGSGTLTWPETLESHGRVNVNIPLVDDGKGLRFNVGGHVFLNKANTHTGGTHFSNHKNTYVRAFALSSDAALGAVPDAPKDNIFAEGGNMALYVESGTVVTHANRQILIADGQTMKVSPKATLRICGIVHGAIPDGGQYPTGTRFHTYRSASWPGITILDPGSGKENHVGRVLVESYLQVASGTLRMTTSEPSFGANGSGEALPLYVNGSGSAYHDKWGHLLVSNGAVVGNYQNDRRFQISNYGHVEVDGGTVTIDSGEFMVGLNTPGKLTLKNGGLLRCKKFRPTQTTAGNGGETYLEKGGVLRVGVIFLDATGQKAVFHFDGGALQSREGEDGTEKFLQEFTDETKWGGVVFSVEKGGAVLDTSNGKNLWFGRPLVSGVAEGETDGGLIARGGNIVVLTDAEHSYNGPTHIETGARVQVRKANALPSGTTLRMGLNRVKTTNIGFNTWADPRTDVEQTVARVEGGGRIYNNSQFAVTEAVAPVYDGVPCTLTFEKPCALAGDYEITGNVDTCSCLLPEQAGQDISGLTLKVVDFATFDKNAGSTFYKILDAPKGYKGEFKPGNVTGAWSVKYTATAAYLSYANGTLISLR